MLSDFFDIAKKLFKNALLLIVFWILLFDFQRVLFTLHNLPKFEGRGFGEWLQVFIYSIRLDAASAGYLSIIPLLVFIPYLIWRKSWMKKVFSLIIFFEIFLVVFIHAGEINAYPEWNHKLTGRVFMHLAHPDEVVRTADYGMMFWFVIYSFLEFSFGWFLKRSFFSFDQETKSTNGVVAKVAANIILQPVILFLFLLMARGGWQPIPININAATYSNYYVLNDLSTNSTYFFGKSFLLYNRTDIDEYIMDISEQEAQQIHDEMFVYDVNHNNYFLENKRPNIVVIVMESWTGNAMGCLTDTKTATPYFDKLTEEGLFFDNIYGVSGTSEIGNSAIFSGFPGIPEVAITTQPEKHRKIPCLNEDLKEWGYTSAYLFSGDLKYGNIGGYFSDHGFDIIEDELDFPKHLPRGKLNYYDEDLYKLLIQKMNRLPEPFMQCAFTGSTHSPYDFPHKEKYQVFDGVEGTFQNSLLYADKSLHDFLENAKKQKWYDNTLFIFVADHGHASNVQQNPSESAYNRIPFLVYGKPLKEMYRGKRISKLGSQADIVRTLVYQLGGQSERYRWSKDLMNPKAPEFALHTINRGYGWVTPSGSFTYHMEMKKNIETTYKTEEEYKREFIRCNKLLALVYGEYKKL